MNQLKVACVQFQPVLGNVKKNLETIANFIQKGEELSIDVMVFPELCVQGYDPKLAASNAEEQNGSSFQFLIDESKFSGIYLVVGIAEKGMVNLKYTVKSTGGHASTPKPKTPITTLAKACTRVHKRPFKARLVQPVKDML